MKNQALVKAFHHYLTQSRTSAKIIIKQRFTFVRAYEKIGHHQRKNNLYRCLKCLCFCILTPPFPHIISLIDQCLAHARAQPFRLDHSRHKKIDLLHIAAFCQTLHSMTPRHAHARIMLHAFKLIDQWSFHTPYDLAHRAFKGQSCLNAYTEQIQKLWQLMQDQRLPLAPLQMLR